MTRSELEEQTDKDLEQMGVKAHIKHLKHPEGSYFNVVTIATPKSESYQCLAAILAECYLEAQVTHRHDIGTLVIDRFASLGAGVALCHHLDNFSRKRGRIIAKGRLLKLLDQGVIG